MDWENILKSKGSHYEKFKEVSRGKTSSIFRSMVVQISKQIFTDYKPSAKDRTKYLRLASHRNVKLEESELMKVYAIGGIKRLVPYTISPDTKLLIKNIGKGLKISSSRSTNYAWWVKGYFIEIRISFSSNLINIDSVYVNLFTPYSRLNILKLQDIEDLYKLYQKLKAEIGEIEGTLVHEVPYIRYKYKGKEYIARTKKYNFDNLSREEFEDLTLIYNKAGNRPAANWDGVGNEE